MNGLAAKPIMLTTAVACQNTSGRFITYMHTQTVHQSAEQNRRQISLLKRAIRLTYKRIEQHGAFMLGSRHKRAMLFDLFIRQPYSTF